MGKDDETLVGVSDTLNAWPILSLIVEVVTEVESFAFRIDGSGDDRCGDDETTVMGGSSISRST